MKPSRTPESTRWLEHTVETIERYWTRTVLILNRYVIKSIDSMLDVHRRILFMNRCWIDAQRQWMHCSQSNYGPSRCPARDSTSDGRGAGFKRLLGTFCRWYAVGECSRAMQSKNATEECKWRFGMFQSQNHIIQIRSGAWRFVKR